MYKKFKKHFGYYLSLSAILLLGIVLVVLTSPNIKTQGLVISLTVFFYVLWGILHHLMTHNLNIKIVIEYILIGAFGLTIIFFLLSVNGNY